MSATIRIRTPLLLLLAASAWLAGTALADEPAEPVDAGKALLDDYLHNVQSMSASFEQSLVDANDIVVESSRGSLDIRRPGQFRWSYTEPYEQILVADGTNIWSYDVDLEQVTVKPQAEVLANTPALLLGGSRDVLDDFEYVESFTDRDTVWIRLRPKKHRQWFQSG